MTHPLIESLKKNNINLDKITNQQNLNYKKYGNLAIFKYNKNAKYGTNLQRLSRGIIIDLETNKLLCSSFSGSLSMDQFIKNVPVNNCVIEENIEGTLINLYFYNKIWRISTKFSINADETKFKSNKTFRQLFDSIIDINILKNLDKNFTYSFVLVHEDLRLVTPVSENKIYHIETTNNITGEKIRTNIGIPHPKIILSGNKYIADNANIETFESYDEILTKLSQLIWSLRGFMLYSIDRNYHCSLINPAYDLVKNLVANQSDKKYICLNSLFYKKNNNEILKYFPEYNDIFVNVLKDYNNLKQTAYKFYLDKKCFKKDINVPLKYNKLLFDIHGEYLKTKNINKKFKVTIDNVDSILRNYECPYLFTLLYK
tara:strand:+ start:533 stop:1648 length:1116 start_codon:yes stop_codon:yes gene_type:complete